MELGHFFMVPVNYFAIILCGVFAMMLGFLWYGPLFGKQWSKLVGLTKDKMMEANKDMPKTYGLMFGASLVMAYVLAHFVWYAAPGHLTLFIALKTAVWAWLGFVATTAVSKYLFTPEKKPLKLLVIDSGYYLVSLLIMAATIYFLFPIRLYA